jgi:hypothetical protein
VGHRGDLPALPLRAYPQLEVAIAEVLRLLEGTDVEPPEPPAFERRVP